jgi:hypothetical protein
MKTPLRTSKRTLVFAYSVIVHIHPNRITAARWRIGKHWESLRIGEVKLAVVLQHALAHGGPNSLA